MYEDESGSEYYDVHEDDSEMEDDSEKENRCPYKN